MHEASSPLASYIAASSYESAKRSAYDFSYGNGRYAILTSNSSNTLKTTPEWPSGSIVAIHGDLAAWVDDQNGPLHFVDTSAKAKNVQTVELPDMEAGDINFSEDGQYLFIENNTHNELLPQQIYDIKNKRFIEIPYFDVTLSDWDNSEVYFGRMSDYDYLEKFEDGYSITNMVKGLYAYNPKTNKTRTIY